MLCIHADILDGLIRVFYLKLIFVLLVQNATALHCFFLIFVSK